MPSRRPLAAATHAVPGQSAATAKPPPKITPPSTCAPMSVGGTAIVPMSTQPERGAHDEQEHRGDDGAEHHAHHGEVAQHELAEDLARIAESGALEDEAERDPDRGWR